MCVCVCVCVCRPFVKEIVYDLSDDLLESDVLMLFRNVQKEVEAQVKAAGQAQFGYLPRMALGILAR